MRHRRRDPHASHRTIEPLERRLLLAADLRISEFLAANESVIADEDGHYADWIEIRNFGTDPADLTGHYLTDDAADLTGWRFPAGVTLAPGQHLLVFASNKNRRDPLGPFLHTNFALDADGGYLALVAPDGSTVVSQYAYGQQEDDVSYGYDPASPGGWTRRHFATPTPGALNQRAEVVINEIHYDPDIKLEHVEFVELHNPGTLAVDLSGARLASGIDYTFPAGTTLPAGGYLIVTQDPAHFQAKFNSPALGPWSGVLSNEGDRIRVLNAAGGELDDVTYGAGFPWPTVGDAPGYSIELIHPDLDNDLGGSWRSFKGANITPPTPSTVTLFHSNSTWSYRKGTSAPPSNWRSRTYIENSTWIKNATAAIGYGDGHVRTVLSDMQGNYTSIFLRKTFTVTDPSQFQSLRLEAQFDDGFVAWINGNYVASYNVNSTNPAYNAVAASAAEDASFRSYTISLANAGLVAGTNVIAVQVLNNHISSSTDAWWDARLIGVTGAQPVTSPSPGQRNVVYATNAAPQMRQVKHGPQQPASGEVVTITAKVTDPDGVASVLLSYQLVDPGAYININDLAYQTNWTTVAMRDDGTGGDAVAGDGTYTVQMPASLQVHRRLVRYRITATDSLGASITGPYLDDPVPNFAYFVYNGIPAWTGSARPGVIPPVTYPASLMDDVQAYHLLSKKQDVEDATWYDRNHGDEYYWRGTLVYNGEVYDHISYRPRGGVWRYAMGKNMWKIDFHRNHPFQAYDNYGRPYPTTWSKLNLSAIIQQGDYWHRGEQGLFESVGFKLFELAGVASPGTHYAQFRIIDEASENGADQFSGDLWGLYLAIEQVDGNFLDAHDLPDGNLYKMEGGTGELNNMGPNGPANKQDLNAFQAAYAVSQTEDWWRQNFNLESYYSYRTILEAIHHYDTGYGKNYFYYHNPVTGQWETIPWDLDLTWADNMYGDGNEPFKVPVLSKPTFLVEYQNRLRELRDLLYNPEQTGMLIDEVASLVYTPGQPSWVDIDRAMWDYNPVMVDTTKVSNNASKAQQGRFYAGGGGVVIPAPGGFAGMIQKMKNYVVTRGAWMDSALGGADPAIPFRPTVTRLAGSGSGLSVTIPVDALTFRSSAFADPQGAGTFAAMEWRLAEVTNPNAPDFDPTQPRKYEVTALWESGELTTYASDITIPGSVVEAGKRYRVRVRMKDSSGRWSNWSLPVEFTAVPSPSSVRDYLRVTEINYHPAPPPLGSPFSKDDFEFIEVTNTSSTTSLNLAGVKFTRGLTFTFGDIVLAPGQSAVVVRNAAAFATRYPTGGMIVAGEFEEDTGLNNSGERLVLEDAAGQVVLDFEYADDVAAGWPGRADGLGRTLVIVNPLADPSTWSDPTSWRESLRDGGTPGALEDALPAGSVLVNEVLTNSDADGDWIELYNPTGAPVDLSGWWLSDSPSQPQKYQLPAGTVLQPGAYLVLHELATFNSAAALAPFALDDEGDEVILSSATPAGVLTGYEHRVSFDAIEPGVTFGRHVLSTLGADFVALQHPTPGEPNAAPRVGPVVINEVMYNAAGDPFGEADFIELRNLTGSPVPLFDVALGESWRLSGGVEYAFGPGASIPAGGYALVVAIDPELFRSRYAVPAGVPIYGPYAGELDAAGERIELRRPFGSAAGVPPVVPTILVDALEYDDEDPWPTAPDGGGPSLGRIVATDHGNDPANWQAEAVGGTPGRPNADAEPPAVTIVPVAPDPRSGGVASIEIHFSEPVTGFEWSDLVLSRNGGPNLLTSAVSLDTDDQATFTLSGLAGLTFIEGVYTLSFVPGHGIADGGGLAPPVMPTETFVVEETIVPGTDGADAFYLRKIVGSGGGYEVYLNATPDTGSPTWVLPGTLTTLGFAGGDGDDTLTLDLAGATAFGGLTPGGVLTFDGGAGDNAVILLGTGGQSASYAPSGTTAGAGVLQVGEEFFYLSNVAAAHARQLAEVTFVTPNSTDALTVSTPSAGRSEVGGESSGVALTPLLVESVGRLVLDTAANDSGVGADEIAVTASSGAGFARLALVPSSGTTEVNVAGNAPIALDLPSLAPSAALSLTVGGSAQVLLDQSSQATLTSLALVGSGRLSLTSGAGPLVVRTLSFADDATLDLADSDLIVAATDVTRAALHDVLWAALARGFRDGTDGPWSGPGLTSSAAAADPLSIRGLALLLNDDGTGAPIHPTFAGQAVQADYLLVKYTYQGDTNLDGRVDAADYYRVDAGRALGRLGYAAGDIDYSGAPADVDDYLLLDTAFIRQQGSLAAGGSAPAALPAALPSAVPTVAPTAAPAAAPLAWPQPVAVDLFSDAPVTDEDGISDMSGTIFESQLPFF